MAIVTLEEILSIWFNTLSKELEPLYTKSISLSTAASIKALKSFVGDEVSFKISIGNKSQVFSFVYAGTIPTLTCSLYLSDDYYYEVAEALFELQYIVW